MTFAADCYVLLTMVFFASREDFFTPRGVTRSGAAMPSVLSANHGQASLDRTTPRPEFKVGYLNGAAQQ